jgi:hypothetical protein
MTVFRDRRTDAYSELTGNRGDYMFTPVPGQNSADIQERNQFMNRLGYSGGELPTRNDIQVKYPVDQTTSVVNMR